MATGICPNCATPRTGSFRFCRSCGLDYDAVPMSTADPVVAVPVPEPAAVDPAGAVIGSAEPPLAPDPGSDAFEPVADVAPAAPDVDPIPPEAAAEFPEPQADLAPTRSADTFVIEKRRLRQWLGAFIGALIGAMLVGAIVVPFFGDALLVLGIAAGIATVVGFAWLGARIGSGSTAR